MITELTLLEKLNAVPRPCCVGEWYKHERLDIWETPDDDEYRCDLTIFKMRDGLEIEISCNTVNVGMLKAIAQYLTKIEHVLKEHSEP